jgi:hypothetical protein
VRCTPSHPTNGSSRLFHGNSFSLCFWGSLSLSPPRETSWSNCLEIPVLSISLTRRPPCRAFEQMSVCSDGWNGRTKVHGFLARRRCNNLGGSLPQISSDRTPIPPRSPLSCPDAVLHHSTTGNAEPSLQTNGAIETLVPERHGLRRSSNSGALPAWWSRGSAVMNAILYPLAHITSMAKYYRRRRDLVTNHPA